jgi:tRNA(adenine34) deaminase
MIDEEYMNIALEEARKAFSLGEIPVGALIIGNAGIIAAGHNVNRSTGIPTKHAEILVIEAAAAAIHNERLNGCTLYVTKEPCAMCAGAIIHARIERLVIGARDFRFGACGTVFSVCGNPSMNHVPEITFGVLELESAGLLQDFFRLRR